MRYGNAAWGFRETPLEQQIMITSGMGLSLLEVGISNAPADIPLTASREELAGIRRLFDAHGVEPWCAATGNDFTAGGNGDVEKVKRVMDMCAELGIRVLRIFAGFSPVQEVTGERWDCMIQALRECAAYSGCVKLAVETHGGVDSFSDGVNQFASVSTDPETLERILCEVPGIDVVYDPANLWAVGDETQEEITEVIRDRTAYIHLKSFERQPSGHIRPAAVGEGDVNLGELLQRNPLLRGGMGPGEGLPILFEYENTWDVEDGLRRSLRNLTERSAMNA